MQWSFDPIILQVAYADGTVGADPQAPPASLEAEHAEPAVQVLWLTDASATLRVPATLEWDSGGEPAS